MEIKFSFIKLENDKIAYVEFIFILKIQLCLTKCSFADFIHTTPQANVAELDVVTSVKEKASSSSSAFDVEGAKEDPVSPAQQVAGPSFWSFEFYKQYFDVNTKQVSDRIVNSMVPRSGQNYLETFIKPKADLYGTKKNLF